MMRSYRAMRSRRAPSRRWRRANVSGSWKDRGGVAPGPRVDRDGRAPRARPESMTTSIGVTRRARSSLRTSVAAREDSSPRGIAATEPGVTAAARAGPRLRGGARDSRRKYAPATIARSSRPASVTASSGPDSGSRPRRRPGGRPRVCRRLNPAGTGGGLEGQAAGDRDEPDHARPPARVSARRAPGPAGATPRPAATGEARAPRRCDRRWSSCGRSPAGGEPPGARSLGRNRCTISSE